MKTKFVQYYVEGQDEEKLLNVLKTQLSAIKPGKVQQLNVVDQEITNLRLRTLVAGTMIVLVFDTDTGNLDILKKNIQILKKCQAVSEVVLVPQVPNLEGELIRCCEIRRITDLLGSRSRTEFKSDLIRVTNLDRKLRQHNFDINKFWSQQPQSPYHEIENQAAMVKITK